MEVERMVQLMLLFWRKPSSCVALVGENHTAARFSTRLKFNLFALLIADAHVFRAIPRMYHASFIVNKMQVASAQ
ncbi:hypothetical protein Lal_00007769 [Lupinus albus]|nr:hypothetical protein Lal_00007769 [Lupinus albus]